MRSTLQQSLLALALAALVSCDSPMSPTDEVVGCYSIHLTDAPANLEPTKVVWLSPFVPPTRDFIGVDIRVAQPSPMPKAPGDWMLDGTWQLRSADSLYIDAESPSTAQQMRYRLDRVQVTIQGGPFVPAEWIGTATYLTGSDSVTWSGAVALYLAACAE